MRLQKYLAKCGVASRRKSEELIRLGEVTVNNIIIKEMGHIIEPSVDIITVNGEKIDLVEEKIYIVLHKPKGYITTVSDQFDRKKVIDLIDLDERIFPVGRLDYDTSGLLVLTNDGELTYTLTHPKHKVEKTYIAIIKGVPTEKELKLFVEGLHVEDYVTSPAKIRIIESFDNKSTVEIKISEGRNRQVRKMCHAINHPVIELKRIATGKLILGNLIEGNWRYLSQGEIKQLTKR
ncbi:MAG: pseudouridine synthase [Alkaliphilus sp.]|nr:MAG: pseudouridine synthase [Alkaliphilus sp.]